MSVDVENQLVKPGPISQNMNELDENISSLYTHVERLEGVLSTIMGPDLPDKEGLACEKTVTSPLNDTLDGFNARVGRIIGMVSRMTQRIEL